MSHHRSTLATAVRGAAVGLVLVLGWSPGATTTSIATKTPVAAATSGTPAPPSPPPAGGALPVHPAGGGGCVIGLNCGCIPHRTCPTRHPRPGIANERQHGAPAAPNP